VRSWEFLCGASGRKFHSAYKTLALGRSITKELLYQRSTDQKTHQRGLGGAGQVVLGWVVLRWGLGVGWADRGWVEWKG